MNDPDRAPAAAPDRDVNARPKIGWIGTGVMGAPMAGHLIDGRLPAWTPSTELETTRPR